MITASTAACQVLNIVDKEKMQSIIVSIIRLSESRDTVLANTCLNSARVIATKCPQLFINAVTSLVEKDDRTHSECMLMVRIDELLL